VVSADTQGTNGRNRAGVGSEEFRRTGRRCPPPLQPTVAGGPRPQEILR
jgi:hypothetical protein